MRITPSTPAAPSPLRTRSAPLPRAEDPSDRLTLSGTPSAEQIRRLTQAMGEQEIGAIADEPTPPTATVVPERLRIGLVVSQAFSTVSVPVATEIGDVTLEAGHAYRLSMGAKGALEVREGDTLLGAVPLPMRLEAPGEGSLTLEGHRYRGALEVIASPQAPGRLTIVNDVGLEDYLKGVLPCEMATGWPTEALRTQAVAARTYAAANMGRRTDQGFDLFPTVADQVYRGLDSEAADTTAAVNATRGIVMRYQGALINALFFSSSGGSTDDANAVWGLDLPYIQAKADPDASPNSDWTATVGSAALKSALAQQGLDVGTPTGLAVSERTPGGRARWLKVTGDRGTAIADANKIRLALGLKSTHYALQKTRGGWTLKGSGYGHGLGMSQWGARARAEAGQDYKQILTFYYSGIEVGP